jgi:hypothetical protein
MKETGEKNIQRRISAYQYKKKSNPNNVRLSDKHQKKIETNEDKEKYLTSLVFLIRCE